MIGILIYVLYTFFEGWREAWHWVYGLRKGNKVLQHGVFMSQRGLVMILTAFYFGSVLAAIGLWLSFFLFHDGFYYMMRGYVEKGINLNVTYNKGFFDCSTTSTALLTFPFGVRLFLALLGGAIFYSNVIGII